LSASKLNHSTHSEKKVAVKLQINLKIGPDLEHISNDLVSAFFVHLHLPVSVPLNKDIAGHQKYKYSIIF